MGWPWMAALWLLVYSASHGYSLSHINWEGFLYAVP